MLPDLGFFSFQNDTLTYGNYGGLDYSAGQFGGTVTGTSLDPAPVDAFDQLFYEHDLAYQGPTTPVELIPAHIAVVEGVVDLLLAPQQPLGDLFF
jgi:hypothetical protein